MSRLWATALALVDAIRSRRPVQPTGTPSRFPGECPSWCAGDHRCTARNDNPAGEHRSKTVMWHTGYGRLSVIAVQDVRGRRWVELAATVEIDPRHAIDTTRMLPPAVDVVIRAVLAGQPDRIVPTPRRARPIREVRP